MISRTVPMYFDHVYHYVNVNYQFDLRRQLLILGEHHLHHIGLLVLQTATQSPRLVCKVVKMLVARSWSCRFKSPGLTIFVRSNAPDSVTIGFLIYYFFLGIVSLR